MSKGRIGKNYGHGWMSRDSKDIDCKATGCLFNILNKCATPSICKITENGSCSGFKAKPALKKYGGD